MWRGPDFGPVFRTILTASDTQTTTATTAITATAATTTTTTTAAAAKAFLQCRPWVDSNDGFYASSLNNDWRESNYTEDYLTAVGGGITFGHPENGGPFVAAANPYSADTCEVAIVRLNNLVELLDASSDDGALPRPSLKCDTDGHLYFKREGSTTTVEAAKDCVDGVAILNLAKFPNDMKSLVTQLDSTATTTTTTTAAAAAAAATTPNATTTPTTTNSSNNNTDATATSPPSKNNGVTVAAVVVVLILSGAAVAVVVQKRRATEQRQHDEHQQAELRGNEVVEMIQNPLRTNSMAGGGALAQQHPMQAREYAPPIGLPAPAPAGPAYYSEIVQIGTLHNSATYAKPNEGSADYVADGYPGPAATYAEPNEGAGAYAGHTPAVLMNSQAAVYSIPLESNATLQYQPVDGGHAYAESKITRRMIDGSKSENGALVDPKKGGAKTYASVA